MKLRLSLTINLRSDGVSIAFFYLFQSGCEGEEEQGIKREKKGRGWHKKLKQCPASTKHFRFKPWANFFWGQKLARICAPNYIKQRTISFQQSSQFLKRDCWISRSNKPRALFQFPPPFSNSISKSLINVVIMQQNLAWWTNRQLWTDLFFIFNSVTSRI